jgi:hypothetical protein
MIIAAAVELCGRTPLSSFLLKEDGVAAYQTMFLVPDETQTYDGVEALELDANGRPLN